MAQKAKYENPNPIHQFVLGRFLSRVAQAVNDTGASSILDVACAEGYVIRFLRERIHGLKFTGVDIDTQALSEARRNLPGVPFFRGDIYSYAHSGPVDLVMALEVLEHLNDVPRALQNMSRVQAKHFLFSVPHEPYFRLMNLLRGRHIKRLGNDPEHINLWSRRTFVRQVEPCFEPLRDYSSFPWTIILSRKRYGESQSS